MSESNMIIGSHSESHPLMSSLSYKDQENQIKNSFEYIEERFSPAMKTYCHSYGGAQSYNADTINILNDSNVDFSLI
jgi:peptidoglycan/xylan/chitin deacetylase (PgdA/CDA1 family)